MRYFAKRPYVYLDYAAATPLSSKARESMEPFLRDKCGNAGSIHAKGVAAARALESARAHIASATYAHPDEIRVTHRIKVRFNCLKLHGFLLKEYEY